MKHIFIAVFILIFALNSFADAPNGLAFLKISPDVRSSGMGETGVAAGDQRAASYYNPALLGGMDSRGLSFAHHKWIQDVGVNFLEAHFKSKLNFGFFVVSTGVEDIEIRTNPTPEPISYVDSRDLALGADFSYTIMSNLHLGLGAKYIYEHLYSDNTDGFALDIGALYSVKENLDFGVSVNNIGVMSEMYDENPTLPLTARFGGAYKFSTGSGGSIMIAAGGNYVNEDEFRGNFGLEYVPIDLIAIRAGYLYNYDDRTLAAGIGLRWKNLGLDFAYVPFENDLGDVQRFGFYLNF